MERKQFYRRTALLVAVMALILLIMGGTLYNIQIVNGDYYYQQSQKRIAETETVESDRGDILDRSGQVLVSNRTMYQVTLNTALMGEPEERNATLLSLLDAAEDHGLSWPDSLPISSQPPFVFLKPDPYCYTYTHKDGTEELRLTRLGKLCMKMKWITQDPTKPAADKPAPAPEEPGALDRLLIALGLKSPPAPPDAEPEKPYALPTAQELLGLMCRSFHIAGEGAVEDEKEAPPLNIGEMDPARARALAGVLYELHLRSKDVYWEPYVFAKEVDIDFISRVKELSLPGVVVEPINTRQYHTTSAAHLLGWVGPITPEGWEYYKELDQGYQQNDTVGREGVEQVFESYLRGTAGVRTIERNAKGKVVGSQWLEEPGPGDNVVLTIDNGLQTMVEQTLAAHLPNLKSKEVEGAACVVLDVKDAGVLACASYPSYDLANFSADFEKNASDPLRPLYNRALLGTYAPGSTFKMVTAIAGLEEGIITPYTKILDKGRYTYYTDDGPMCWIYRQYGRTHGYETVSEAITDSCNYFFFEVGRQLGIYTLVDYATRFGLGEKTGLELDENEGVMASPEYTESLGGTWYDGNTLSVAIGQESSKFTPIQLANYIATLVNGGTRNATHLLKEVRSSDNSQVLETYTPRVLGTVQIQPENLEAVKRGMLNLTTEGSVAWHFRDVGVPVGAKTGSAQVSIQTEANAVFVCFAPYDDPQIAMAVVVEHGGSGSELGAIAADIVRYQFAPPAIQELLLAGADPHNLPPLGPDGQPVLPGTNGEALPPEEHNRG